jgi:hypothetical protein
MSAKYYPLETDEDKSVFPDPKETGEGVKVENLQIAIRGRFFILTHKAANYIIDIEEG